MKKHINNKNKQLLKENPDHVRYLNDAGDPCYVNYEYDNAFPFIVDFKHNKVFVGELSKCHYPLIMNTITKIASGEEENIFGVDMKNWQDVDRVKDFLFEDCYHGRIWMDEKIISFYYIPNKSEMQTAIPMIQSAVKDKMGVSLNLYDYYLDTNIEGNDGYDIIKPLSEYVGAQTDIKTQNSKQIPHFMDADDKRSDPDMWGYIQDRTKNQVNKLTNPDTGKEMTAAEYNNLRRIGDSKVYIQKLVESAIDDYYQKLIDAYWESEEFKEKKRAHNEPDPEYLQNRAQLLANKLGDMSPSEYNYYKRYGIGDNTNRNNKNNIIENKKMNKVKVTLSESELTNVIKSQVTKIINEHKKHKSLKDAIQKCVNEAFSHSDYENMGYGFDAEDIFDNSEDFEYQDYAEDVWNKNNQYWNDYDNAENFVEDFDIEQTLENIVRESVVSGLTKRPQTKKPS